MICSNTDSSHRSPCLRLKDIGGYVVYARHPTFLLPRRAGAVDGSLRQRERIDSATHRQAPSHSQLTTFTPIPTKALHICVPTNPLPPKTTTSYTLFAPPPLSARWQALCVNIAATAGATGPTAEDMRLEEHSGPVSPNFVPTDAATAKERLAILSLSSVDSWFAQLNLLGILNFFLICSDGR